MLIRNASEIMLNKALGNCEQVQELVQHLKVVGIEGFTYQLFNDIHSHKVRSVNLMSDLNLTTYYLNKIHQISENAFVELQPFPFHKSTFFSPYDTRYCTHDSNRKLDYEFGYKNILCLSMHDPSLKTTELFWFNSSNEDLYWILKQIDNKKLLNQFILIFKDKMQKTINKPMLSENQMEQISTQINKCKALHLPDTRETNIDFGSFKVKDYFLGHPFKEKITHKEFQILKCYFLNMSSKEMAKQLKISPRTVDTKLGLLLSKTHCNSLKELKKAIRYSFILNNH